jgi:microcystin-dependent protein
MGADPYIGEIAIYPYTYLPKGWLQCNGALLPIEQYTSLYSLIGTIYGGDGRTTFALPNLNGRMVIGSGVFLGRRYLRGQFGGTDNTRLTVGNMANHLHDIELQCQSNLGATTENGDQAAPGPDSILAKDVDTTGGLHPVMAYASNIKQNTTLGGLAVTGQAVCHSAGKDQAFEIRNPFMALAFCMAFEGTYPERS